MQIDRFVIYGISGVVAVVLLLVLGGVLSNGSLPWAPEAKVLVSEQPTAKIDISVHKGEILLLAYDAEGKTTREPGILEMTVLKLDDFRNAQDASYTQVTKTSMTVDRYDLIYLNNYGHAANVYAYHTGIRVNGPTTLYNVWMQFYPKDANYNVFASVYTPGST
jgi:hypothetical protein